MKFGKLLKGSDRNLLLKLYFIFGSALIMFFFVIYSNRLIFHARKDAHIVPNLFARYFTLLTDSDWESEIWKDRLVEYIQEHVFQNIDYKIIVTDSNNEPIAWKNIEVDNLPYRYLDTKKQQMLREELKGMHSANKIALQFTSTDSLYAIPLAKAPPDSFPDTSVFGYVYYSEPFSMKQLRYMPVFEMALVLVFVIFGLHGVFLVKKSEKDKLWIGLAKETAHQFGTPISSMLAWLDLLKMRIESSCEDVSMIEMIDHMKADVAHLQKVANRFGKVGSVVKLKPCGINKILEETIEYFNTRLPNLDNEIEIHLISKIDDIIINVDPDLIRWTIENLVRNSIDAMKNKGGNIILTATSKNGNTYIQVRDEGIGIPKSKYSKIFEPGITSKSRGWGLGLSLAKRIVEDYHKGRIRVLESTVGEGTTIEIMLPEK